MGFSLVATRGTSEFFRGSGIECHQINKIYEGRPNIADAIKNEEIALVINSTEGRQTVADSLTIRTAAIQGNVPYCTTAAAAHVIARVLKSRGRTEFAVRTLQSVAAA